MIHKLIHYQWKSMYSSKDKVPTPRWGHASVVINNEFVIFGGYADTFYKGDLWVYNSETRKWLEVQTTGNVPSCRSNCSLNYDKANNRLVLFGGGGPNKKKYNSIHVLDWLTKQWKVIEHKGEIIPQQRTYHTAQIIGSYLVVFGGEGFTDLNCLWIFDFKTLKWNQVLFLNKNKPVARRFHTSNLINNKMFIIGGCFSKYRSLNDLWELDFNSFINSQKYQNLQWKQVKLQGAPYLTRWGHTSSVLDNKIIVFGGRFSSDLNDLMEIDLTTKHVKSVKKVFNLPSPRRRPCCGFMGRSLFMFGGFNGQYFNDYYFLTFPQEASSFPKSNIIQKLSKQALYPIYANQLVNTLDGQVLINNQILLSNAFYNNFQKLRDFKSLLGTISKSQAQKIIKRVYLGSCISYKTPEKFEFIISQIEPQYRTYVQSLSLSLLFSLDKEVQNINFQKLPIIFISNKQWQQITKNLEGDITFKMGSDLIFKAKSSLLSLNSVYFSNLFENNFSEESKTIEIKSLNLAFKVLIKYLQYQILFIPEYFQEQNWMQLIQYSKYYHLPSLTKICQNQLISNIYFESNYDMLKFSIKNNLKQLQKHCSQIIVRHQCSIIASQSNSLKYNSYQDLQLKDKQNYQMTKIETKMLQLKNKTYKELYFDIYHNISNEMIVFPGFLRSKYSMKNQEKNRITVKGKENINFSVAQNN